MKKSHVVTTISLMIVASLCLSMIVESTKTAAISVSQAESQVNYIKNKKAELEETLSDLEEDKNDIVKYITKLDKKITKLSENIKEVKVKISSLNRQIRELKREIVSAEADIDNQYETMKKRIKYMYEKGDSDYIDILLESNSLSDLLNRAEYIEKISEYDNNMLGDYIQAKEELEKKKEELEAKKSSLDTEREALKLEQDAAIKVSEKKNKELDKYNKKISKTEGTIEHYEGELAKQEEILMQALLERQREIERQEAERKAAEEAAKKAAEEEAKKAKKEDDSKPDDSENEDADSTPSPTSKTKRTKTTPTPAPQKQVTTTVSGFSWPLSVSGTITSRFGSRTSPTAGASSYHQGIDISASAGTAIKAAKGGTVVSAAYSSAAGNYVMISHGGGVYTIYMHASSLNVQSGQTVSQGETIAYVGMTGVATGNHLHFGISVNGEYVDPMDYL